MSSTLGVGSEFWVELEFGLASPESLDLQPTMAVPDDQPGLPGARVLVVDDSDINREVAKRILELEGAQVSLAGNGQEAIELCDDDSSWHEKGNGSNEPVQICD